MAGATAALLAARAGAEVVLYEAAPGLGGRCHRHESEEFQYGGKAWRFDLEHGVHGVWRQYRNLRRLLQELGTADALEDVGGQEFIAPTIGGGYGAWDFATKVRGSKLPSALANLRMFGAGDFAIQALRDRPTRWLPAAAALTHAFAFDGRTDVDRYDDISVGEYVADWPRYLQRLSGAITHSAFFREPEQVSLAAYFTGLQGYFISDKRDTAFGVLRNDSVQDLFGPLQAELESLGGQVRLQERVVELRFDDDRCTAVVSKPARGRQRTKRVDAAIVALDPPGLQALAADGPLRAAIGDAVIPDGIASTIVRLWFTSPPSRTRPNTGVFASAAADNFFWLHRLQRGFERWHKETGGGVLECHLYGDRADESAGLTDDALLVRTRAIAQRCWPELDDSCVHGHVQRNPSTHVAFGPGVMANVPTVPTASPNVALCGDWIACDAAILYLERATITGMLAARHITEAVGLDANKVPEPLPSHPPAASIGAFRQLFRQLREAGYLPMIGATSA